MTDDRQLAEIQALRRAQQELVAENKRMAETLAGLQRQMLELQGRVAGGSSPYGRPLRLAIGGAIFIVLWMMYNNYVANL